MRISSILLSILLTIVLPIFANALVGDGKIGAEWTFSNSTLIDAGRGRLTNNRDNQGEAIKAWLSEIQKRCPDCKISGTYVEVPGDFWFKLDTDPWVIEVTTRPLSTREYDEDELKQRVQDLVWNSAAAVGLTPHWRVGGGHVHFDIHTHFGDDAFLFRNFVADLMNHPELFMGALSLDYLNAPPLAIQTAQQRNAFETLLKDFDAGGMTLNDFKMKMRVLVYNETFFKGHHHARTYPDKYQALNLDHNDTIEIRGARPQESFEHFLLFAKLFQARIEMLKKVTTPITYIKKDYSDLVAVKTVHGMQFYKTDLDPEIILDSFKSYVEGAGLKWEDYKPLLTRELSVRLQNKTRKKQNQMAGEGNRCESLFTEAQ